MPRKHHVSAVLEQQRLHCIQHVIHLVLVRLVAVVPAERRAQKYEVNKLRLM